MGMCQSFENLFNYVIRLNSEKGTYYRSLFLQYLNKNDTILLLLAYGCPITDKEYHKLLKYSIDINSWSLFEFTEPKFNKDTVYTMIGSSSLKFCEKYLDTYPVFHPKDLSNKERYRLRLSLIWNAAVTAHNPEIVEKYIDEITRPEDICGSTTKGKEELIVFLSTIYRSHSEKLFDKYLPETLSLIYESRHLRNIIALYGKEWMIDKFEKDIQSLICQEWMKRECVTRNILQREFRGKEGYLNKSFLKRQLENLNFEALDWCVENKIYCPKTKLDYNKLHFNKITLDIIAQLLKYGVPIQNIIEILMKNLQYKLLGKIVDFYSSEYTKEKLIYMIQHHKLYWRSRTDQININETLGLGRKFFLYTSIMTQKL